MIYTVLGFCLLLLTASIWYLKSSKKKPQEENKEPLIKTKEPEIESFKEVESFNESEYINDIFKDVFYSILVDSDWTSDVNYSVIELKKITRVDNYNSKTLRLKATYGFDYRSREFEVKEITIETPRNTLRFEGISPTDVYKKLYTIYSDWKNEINEKKKNEIDSSVSYVKEMIGKSTLRDSKISSILGDV